MASESCPICGEEADADVLDPHGHFTSDDVENDGPASSDDDENHGFASEEDYLRSLKQDDNYTFTYSFEYIAKNHGNDKYDIDTADMVVSVDWSDAQAGYVISYDIPDMNKIDPGQGNSGPEEFYVYAVESRVLSDLESLGIGPGIITS